MAFDGSNAIIGRKTDENGIARWRSMTISKAALPCARVFFLSLSLSFARAFLLRRLMDHSRLPGRLLCGPCRTIGLLSRQEGAGEKERAVSSMEFRAGARY